MFNSVNQFCNDNKPLDRAIEIVTEFISKTTKTPQAENKELLCRFLSSKYDGRHYHNLDHLNYFIQKSDEIIQATQFKNDNTELNSIYDLYINVIKNSGSFYIEYNKTADEDKRFIYIISILIHDLIIGKSLHVYKSDEGASFILGTYFIKEIIEYNFNNIQLYTIKNNITNYDTNNESSIKSLFHDADYAILGEGTINYLEYADKIKREYTEYHKFSLDNFKNGRTLFLNKLLERIRNNGGLYELPYCKDNWNYPAFRNITKELKLLERDIFLF